MAAADVQLPREASRSRSQGSPSSRRPNPPRPPPSSPPRSMQHPPPATAPRYPFAYVNSGTEGFRIDAEGSSSLQQQQQHSLRATAPQAPPPLYAVAPLSSPSPAAYAHMSYPPAAHHHHHHHHQNYPHEFPPPPMAAASASANGLRYLIPPQPAPLDQRAMSGVRGKKEIKRRTKTGCLTCRKRRIKCDETQPTCRNCAKSKRECLGYDPIFKQQAAPATIQPAPAGSAPLTASRASTSPPLPSSTQNFTQPQQSFATPVTSYAPPAQYDGPSEYQHPLQVDPALGDGHHPLPMMARDTLRASIQPQRKARVLSIDELFALDGVPPRFANNNPPRQLLPAQQDEVRQFYHFHYAAGLDRLFETDWYTMQGLSHLQSNAQLQDYVYQCAEQMRTAPGDPATSTSIRSLEARLVWQLAIMPLSSAPSPQLATRIETLQALLTGQFLPPHRVPTSPPPPPAELPNKEQQQQIEMQYRQNVFWHHLAAFTAARDDLQDPSALKQVNSSLAEMRGILSNMENRDVLYSIAIARHIGGRLPGHHPGRHVVPSNPDPQDDINKLTVAQKFIEMEDQKGTTQVIQRICSMALRGFVLQKQ